MLWIVGFTRHGHPAHPVRCVLCIGGRSGNIPQGCPGRDCPSRRAALMALVQEMRKPTTSKTKPPSLQAILDPYLRQRFCLDCGHHVTFGYNLGNNVVILNGKELRVICTECGY